MGHADNQFDKAKLAVKKLNYDYAIALYHQGLVLEPKRPEERRILHQVAIRAIEEKGGNPAGGIGVKLRVLKPEANAKKFHLQKKYEQELIELEKILQHQPQNTGTLFALGCAFECLEWWDCSASTFEEIVGLESAHVEASRKLGNICAQYLDDPEKAIVYWEKVKTYKPDDKEASKAIRDISAAQMVRNAEKRKAEGGDESFRSLLKDEEESEDLQKRAQVIRNDDDRRRAIKFKFEEIKADPKNSRLHRDLGSLLADLKLWDKAEQSFNNALTVNPTDLYAKERLGQLQETRMDEELEALRKKSNGDPQIEEQIKRKTEEVLQFKIDEYGRRVAAHPTDYGLKSTYGRLLMEGGKFDEAIGQFQKAVKDPKQKVGSKKSIGKCFSKKELYDIAKIQFEEALDEVADKESDIWKEIKYELALACEKNGEKALALASYQEIMSIDIVYRDVSQRVDALRNSG